MLAGCATPGKTHFHTLSVSPAMPVQVAGAAAYRVAIGPATVPDALDRPQLVLVAGPSRSVFSDAENWSAPLKREIPRVLAEVVGQRLTSARVGAYAQHGGQDADFGVLIEVRRFESKPGESITLEVLWTVRDRNGERLRETRSVLVEPVSVPGIAPLVRAHEKALVALGQEIAEAIEAISRVKR